MIRTQRKEGNDLHISDTGHQVPSLTEDLVELELRDHIGWPPLLSSAWEGPVAHLDVDWESRVLALS